MLLVLLKIILLPLLSPLCVGLVRKVKAIMQNRQGASIIQPYFDLWKLFHKDEVISHDASWIFRFTPYILFAISLFLMMVTPLFGSTAAPPFGDFLTVIFLLATGVFFLALAGIDVGSPFGGFASSREMTLAAWAEALLVLSFLPVAFLTNTTNLIMMAVLAENLSTVPHLIMGLAFLGYIIALFAETGRIPFDNPATHLELTMIHEAMIIEYSGKRLAIIEWANANKMLFFVLLGVNVFFPLGLTTAPNILSFSTALGISLLKAAALLIVVAAIESLIARYRFFKLPTILLTGFVFAILAIIATSIL